MGMFNTSVHLTDGTKVEVSESYDEVMAALAKARTEEAGGMLIEFTVPRSDMRAKLLVEEEKPTTQRVAIRPDL